MTIAVSFFLKRVRGYAHMDVGVYAHVHVCGGQRSAPEVDLRVFLGAVYLIFEIVPLTEMWGSLS